MEGPIFIVGFEHGGRSLLAAVLDHTLKEHHPKNFALDSNNLQATWISVSEIEGCLTKWPNSRFIYIVRNGLDVLACQSMAGILNETPDEFAAAWAKAFMVFRTGVEDLPDRYYVLKYEDLMDSPKRELKRLLKWLGFRYHKKALEAMGSVVEASATWQDLTGPQINLFLKNGEAAMKALKYPIL